MTVMRWGSESTSTSTSTYRPHTLFPSHDDRDPTGIHQPSFKDVLIGSHEVDLQRSARKDFRRADCRRTYGCNLLKL